MAVEQGSDSVWYEGPESNLGQYHAFWAFLDLSEEAPVPTDGNRRWYVSDHNALSAAMRLEGSLRSEGIPGDAPPDVRAELNGFVDDWHTALPFSEAERAIVCDAYQGAPPNGPQTGREIPGHLRRQEFELMNAGLRNVVKGRDLVRHWWSWRRELDEFEGQGSLRQAKDALIHLTGRLVPPDKMPNVYYDLQGIERPVPYGRD